jgi:hypothetical protein
MHAQLTTILNFASSLIKQDNIVLAIILILTLYQYIMNQRLILNKKIIKEFMDGFESKVFTIKQTIKSSFRRDMKNIKKQSVNKRNLFCTIADIEILKELNTFIYDMFIDGLFEKLTSQVRSTIKTKSIPPIGSTKFGEFIDENFGEFMSVVISEFENSYNEEVMLMPMENRLKYHADKTGEYKNLYIQLFRDAREKSDKWKIFKLFKIR